MAKEKPQSDTYKSRSRERTIAILGCGLYFEIPICVFRAIRDAARRNGYELLYFSGEVYKSSDPFDTQANILYDMISPRIADGLVVTSSLLYSPNSSGEFRERCAGFHPLPVVSLGFPIEGIPSVVPDNATGMHDAVCHLIDVHRLTRIAFLSGQRGHPDESERFAAFARAMETRGLAVDESLLLEGNFQQDSGTRAVMELLDVRKKFPGRDVQAVVCCNDYMASGVMLELQRRGIGIPDEIALVGFDDIRFTSCLNPAMSTVHQPFDTMAEKAIESLLLAIEGKTVPDIVRVGAGFIPRDSCGCRDAMAHTGDNAPPVGADADTLSPREIQEHLNSRIVKSIKPTLVIWERALSRLREERKWDEPGNDRESHGDRDRSAWDLLSRLAIDTFTSDNYQDLIYNLGSALISTLELPELMRILTRSLPEVGVKRCCLCVYENPENTPIVLPAWSRLILAFDRSRIEDLPPGGMRFPTTALLPAAIAEKQGWQSWVILALYYREQQLGYILLDIDAPHEHIHRNLRYQVSSALMGARLLEETRRAHEQKTRFFINVAHETKTPLTLIRNYLALYMKHHEHDESLLVLEENIDLLLGHMLDFLDVERLQKGEMIYRHDAFVDLSRAARRKSELFKPIASKKNISITVHADEGVIVRIDPRALDRIFNNLLDNAVNYIQEGGSITIDVGRDGARALLRICDNGPGLPDDTIEHMFEPYYLLSKKKSGQQGIGVGLSIVKKILDGLGASITVETRGGSGTIFVISFEESSATEPEVTPEIPHTEPLSSRVHETAREKNISGLKRSILVVDDNIRLLKFIQTSLSESYNVFLATSADEALAKLKVMPRPDVIISDVMMDDTDGFGLLSALSTKERFSDIPFIFLTALGGEKEKLHGLSLGAVDYIEKPFSIVTLQAKIESIIVLRVRQEKQDRERILDKINGLLSGSRVTAGESADSNFERLCEKYRIDGREREILVMIFKRMVNKEIASVMGISQRAAEYHITRIFRKCGVQNKQGLLDIFNSIR